MGNYVAIHDSSDETPSEISIKTGTAQTARPYAVLKLGPDTDVFITPGRLQQLQETIQFYLVRLAEQEAEERAERAIEQRDALETGADRCPPRQ